MTDDEMRAGAMRMLLDGQWTEERLSRGGGTGWPIAPSLVFALADKKYLAPYIDADGWTQYTVTEAGLKFIKGGDDD